MVGAREKRQPAVSIRRSRYEGSSVVVGPPGAVITIHGDYQHKGPARAIISRRGICPMGEMSSKSWGPGFTLLALEADPAAAQIEEQAARSLNVPLKIVRDRYEGDMLNTYAGLVLARLRTSTSFGPAATRRKIRPFCLEAIDGKQALVQGSLWRALSR